MLQYRATTPSAQRKDPKTQEPIEGFKGNITLGIRFENHQAIFSDLQVKPSLGLTAEQVARAMVLDYDYRVEQTEDGINWKLFDPTIHKKAAATEAVGATPSKAKRTAASAGV